MWIEGLELADLNACEQIRRLNFLFFSHMFQASNYELAFTSQKMLFYAGAWGLAVRCRRFEPSDLLNEDDYFELTAQEHAVLFCSRSVAWTSCQPRTCFYYLKTKILFVPWHSVLNRHSVPNVLSHRRMLLLQDRYLSRSTVFQI